MLIIMDFPREAKCVEDHWFANMCLAVRCVTYHFAIVGMYLEEGNHIVCDLGVLPL